MTAAVSETLERISFEFSSKDIGKMASKLKFEVGIVKSKAFITPANSYTYDLMEKSYPELQKEGENQ
jgi:hypothetical protein